MYTVTYRYILKTSIKELSKIRMDQSCQGQLPAKFLGNYFESNACKYFFTFFLQDCIGTKNKKTSYS